MMFKSRNRVRSATSRTKPLVQHHSPALDEYVREHGGGVLYGQENIPANELDSSRNAEKETTELSIYADILGVLNRDPIASLLGIAEEVNLPVSTALYISMTRIGYTYPKSPFIRITVRN
jgi:hypothetical protein